MCLAFLMCTTRGQRELEYINIYNAKTELIFSGHVILESFTSTYLGTFLTDWIASYPLSILIDCLITIMAF